MISLGITKRKGKTMKINASGITMTFEEFIALDATIELALQEGMEKAYNLGVVDGITLGVEQALLEEVPSLEDDDNLLELLLGF